METFDFPGSFVACDLNLLTESKNVNTYVLEASILYTLTNMTLDKKDIHQRQNFRLAKSRPLVIWYTDIHLKSAWIPT